MNKDDQAPNDRRAITRREVIAASAAAAAVLTLGTSGIYGYFTGIDERRNTVSIAQNLQIRVVEPHWRPENARAVVPGQVIPKDPQIENLHDKVPGYLFLEIRVPTAVVSLYDPETESVLTPARTELFVYEASDTWILLQEFEDGDEMVRRYAWPDPVPAHGNTDPLFEEIVFADLADVQGQQGKKKVTATGYGIQSEGFTNPQDAWQAYKLQNGIGDGTPPASDADDHWQFWLGSETEKVIGPAEIEAQCLDIAKNGDDSPYIDDWYGRMAYQEPLYFEWGDGTIRTASVIGINHDDRSDGAGKAGVTFLFDDLVGKTYSLGRVTQYASLSYLSDLGEGGEIRALVPEQLEAAVKSVRKLTVAQPVSSQSPSVTDEKFWVLSGKELFGNNNCTAFNGESYLSSYSRVNDEGEQYEWFDGYLNMGISTYSLNVEGGSGWTYYIRKCPYSSSSSGNWWLRSYAPTSGGYKIYVTAEVSGRVINRVTGSVAAGIAPCFCI